MKIIKEVLIKDKKQNPRVIIGWNADLVNSEEAEGILKKAGIEVYEKN